MREFETMQQPREPENTSRMSRKTRDLLLFFGALCIFLSSLSMCMILIIRSAEVEPLPIYHNIQPLEYVVNMQQPENIVVPSKLEAPESKNDSEILNFLFIGVDSGRAETFILASVNMHTKQLAMLSLPRDTYVAGSYSAPRLGSVYSAASDDERGIQAVREKAKEMIGFWPDYYLVLDQESLTQIFELTGDISFDVPEDLDYTEVESGEQYIDSLSALKLFGCRSNYTEVETDSALVQRDLLQAIIGALIEQTDKTEENSAALKAAMDTDMSAEDLAYMAYFLHGLDLSSVVGFSLPGDVIEVEDRDYYQVEPEGAIALLNRFFNPWEEDLTIFDVNFRQLEGGSDEGTWEPFGFDSDDDDESTSSTEDDDEEPTGSSKPTDSTGGTETTNPSDPPSVDPPADPE